MTFSIESESDSITCAICNVELTLEVAPLNPISKEHMDLLTGNARRANNFRTALNDAAVTVGWRRVVRANLVEYYCPDHVASLRLVCERCGFAECSCMGGPRLDARPA
jgi:hypothetical protein